MCRRSSTTGQAARHALAFLLIGAVHAGLPVFDRSPGNGVAVDEGPGSEIDLWNLPGATLIKCIVSCQVEFKIRSRVQCRSYACTCICNYHLDLFPKPPEGYDDDSVELCRQNSDAWVYSNAALCCAS